MTNDGQLPRSSGLLTSEANSSAQSGTFQGSADNQDPPVLTALLQTMSQLMVSFDRLAAGLDSQRTGARQNVQARDAGEQDSNVGADNGTEEHEGRLTSEEFQVQ